MIKSFRKNSGFSLVELVVACLLISVLVAIGVPAYLNSRHDADKQKAIFNLYAICQAHKLYYAEQRGPFIIAPLLGDLSPDYANISVDDGSWTYIITASDIGPPPTFTARADHKRPDGTFDGNSLSIDETGTIDESGWPY